MSKTNHAHDELEVALSRLGLRSTRQREQVYEMIHDNKDHPTADEVYALAKENLPSLSLATVYNCLETLVACGLVREVHSGRPPIRYEPAHEEHAHFICGDCGEVFDIKISDTLIDQLKSILPKGFNAESVHLRFHGHAECEDEIDCEEQATKSGLVGKTLG